MRWRLDEGTQCRGRGSTRLAPVTRLARVAGGRAASKGPRSRKWQREDGLSVGERTSDLT